MRILVVEDNFLVSETIRELFEECGCQVVGPVGRVDQAMQRAEEGALDGAVLDINLAGELCFPLARRLLDTGVPIMFLTGYGEAELIPPEFRNAPRLAKPFDGPEVVRAAALHFVPDADQDEPRSSSGAGAPSSNS
ncbi:MAG: response regulator [Alphaproteobacteria bacterium]|nr:response regulator [Alphaproteobacteria bacterium]MCW5740006.1 response regulator [Alphaproteobacteria bacterium]